MSEHPSPLDGGLPRHVALDRFGKASLRMVHELGQALAEEDTDDIEPVLVRAGGPHRSIDALAALIDEALEEPPADREADLRAGGTRPDGVT